MANEARNRVPSAAANGKNGHSLISDAKFRQLYELALRLQLVTKRASGDGAHCMRGREAMLAGIAADLRSDDEVIAEQGALVADLLHVAIPFGSDRRSFEERTIAVLSDAVADRMRKTGRVRVIFSTGKQAEKILKEARSIACAAKLAVLFVEDRSSGKMEATEPSRKTKGLPASADYPTIPVDAQDVVAVYRVAHESITRARDGGGPTHIVGVPWRIAASGRKSAGARIEMGSEDAVVHLEQWLTARGLPAQEWRRAIVAEFEGKDATHGFGGQAAETRAIA